MRGDVRLAEDDRLLGVEAGGEEHRRKVERRPAQLGWVVVDRDRVQVDDAEVRLAALLRLDVLPEAARVVPERLLAGGLNAREDFSLGLCRMSLCHMKKPPV